MAHTRGVHKRDLEDQIGAPDPRPFLYCRKCGSQFSANSGDYFNCPDNYIFKCCKRNMVLAVAETYIRVVRA